MSLLADNPILNSPFEEPIRYWAYEEGWPVDLKHLLRPRPVQLLAQRRRDPSVSGEPHLLPVPMPVPLLRLSEPLTWGRYLEEQPDVLV